jgi:hypothetical protein
MAAFFYEEDRPGPEYEAWEQQRAAQENRCEIAKYREWRRKQQMSEEAQNLTTSATTSAFFRRHRALRNDSVHHT